MSSAPPVVLPPDTAIPWSSVHDGPEPAGVGASYQRNNGSGWYWHSGTPSAVHHGEGTKAPKQHRSKSGG